VPGSAEPAFLLLGCDGQFPFVLFSEQTRRGKNSTDIMPELIGKTIETVAMQPGDRVMEIRFSDCPDRLLLQLFTHRANFFRVDRENRILGSFKQNRQLSGSTFVLPDNERPVLENFDAVSFAHKFQVDRPRALQSWLTGFDLLNSLLAREVCFRAGLDPQSPDLSSTALEGLFEQIQDLLAEYREAAPRVYLENDLPQRFAPGDLLHPAFSEVRPFDDINSALRWFNFQQIRLRAILQKRRTLSASLQRKISALQHAKEQLLQAPESPDKSEHFKKLGQLLVSQPHLLLSGLTEVEAVDYFSSEMQPIRIAVDPAKSAVENAEVYFQKAHQSRRDAGDRSENLTRVTEQLEMLEDIDREMQQAADLKNLEKIERELKAQHIVQYRGEAEAGVYRLPYKQYDFKGYVVWVGRNARDNDALTFRHAAGEDLWLHVQGYSGSHVVIRTGNRTQEVPSAVIDYAARLAVTFSSARHASYVPVVYTRVKYVRKPRKAAPGAVLPERVKTVYADPI
ncbi:MAG TPA: NFACT family protein, partial [Calditrichia bacterium]|nr:NFACT family protein [Calditrichia bacterium]